MAATTPNATSLATTITTIRAANATTPSATTTTTTLSTPSETDLESGLKLPYVIIIIVIIWVSIVGAYFLSRWRQKPKNTYVLPRVFVLCSPRNVQFHYELILRIGLPSSDFNPEKHDIDFTVLGDQRNEMVPLTRLNTNTLLDEPIITSLSLIVYRLVEMPKIKACVLKHSGPFKSWIYVYDLTMIDLTTNTETYFIINQYIGAFNRVVTLEEEKGQQGATFPIDDVPLPQWTVEDIFTILFATINWILLSVTTMALNCGYLHDLLTVLVSSVGAGCLLSFLEWLIYYRLKWNQERREYFNLESWSYWPSETVVRLALVALASVTGAVAIYFAVPITDVRSSVVWLLAVTNTCIVVLGFWNMARQVSAGERVVNWGLKLSGVESVPVGMQYSDMISPGSSDSRSDDGSTISNSVTSKLVRSFGPRSSVKSFGFAPQAPGAIVASGGLARTRSNLSNSGHSTPSSSLISSTMTRPNRHASHQGSSSSPKPGPHSPKAIPAPIVAASQKTAPTSSPAPKEHSSSSGSAGSRKHHHQQHSEPAKHDSAGRTVTGNKAQQQQQQQQQHPEPAAKAHNKENSGGAKTTIVDRHHDKSQKKS